jgi:hypothetical protein
MHTKFWLEIIKRRGHLRRPFFWDVNAFVRPLDPWIWRCDSFETSGTDYPATHIQSNDIPYNTTLKTWLKSGHFGKPRRKNVNFTLKQAVNAQRGSRDVINFLKIGGRGIVIGTMTRLRNEYPTNPDSLPGTGKRFSSSRKCPDRLWGSAIFPFSGNTKPVPQGKKVGAWSLPHVLPRLRISGFISSLPLMPLWCTHVSAEISHCQANSVYFFKL